MLTQALDAADIVVKKEHIDGFYQALHRHHYPSLQDFVEQYYRNERDASVKGLNGGVSGMDNSQNTTKDEIGARSPGEENPAASIHDPVGVGDTKGVSGNQPFFPLKNAVSNRRNRNRINLPKVFLVWLADPNNGFVTLTSKVKLVKTSGDKSTTKLAIQLQDGQLVESVLMRYAPKEEGDTVLKCGRASLCVSRYIFLSLLIASSRSPA